MRKLIVTEEPVKLTKKQRQLLEQARRELIGELQEEIDLLECSFTPDERRAVDAYVRSQQS